MPVARFGLIPFLVLAPDPRSAVAELELSTGAGLAPRLAVGCPVCGV
jgi:hypothetical protein